MTAHLLWYTAPATDWEREALPIGNGAMGAMVFGGVEQERLQFNEKTLWSGGPGSREGYAHGNWATPRPGALATARAAIDADGTLADERAVELLGGPRQGYGSYQSFGDVRVDFADLGEISGYRRELDLREAIARVRFTAGTVTHTREYFASHPGGVLAGRISTDRPGHVSFTLCVDTAHPARRLPTPNGTLVLAGELADNGLRFEAQLRLTAEGGTVSEQDGAITVQGADAAWFVLAAGTDYAPAHPHYRGADPHTVVAKAVDTAAGLPFAQLRHAHVADHRALFDRVDLDLGTTLPADVPTDELLAAHVRGEHNTALEKLLFDHGRYLLIASSRPGSLPANLQGVWNDSIAPPWGADYHTNINLQMNYWPAEVCGLAETAEPLFDFIDLLRPPGRSTARAAFGAAGWVVHNETTPYAYTGVHDWPTAFWFPEAAAWLVRDLYEHYRFTGDLAFLRGRAYPAMREAAEFWLDTLHTDPTDGTLVASPGYSPEHGSYTAGPSMSQQILWDLLTSTAEAAALTGDDTTFGNRLHETLNRLDPGLRIGSWGQLQEWKADIDDPHSHHRHASHLFALHPGSQITPGTAYAEAARVSLDARGDGGTGWSKAWKINFWARLRDGDRAHRLLTQQLTHSTLPNLFDTHPPFQIDGNFGATAGIAEMLLHSHLAVIDILPALPAAWPEGAVTGLRARGGAVVDIQWKSGRATELALTATRTAPLTVRSTLFPDNHLVDAETGLPVTVTVTGSGELLGFHAEAGRRYTTHSVDCQGADAYSLGKC
ncbi:glycoside hydrolase family 95 protein [Streptomyces sp. FIT100]|uniref:glycoside hydrolase family 95 protein n=1 Tax=Streptomyces sp. FIT100 TaxID=2837956 RepID=UPI0021C7F9B9|nr:glycoside hydrolase family 95 protein [Streptomyces sp. FIT100]UUN25661.1 glycoside hydrolase N-terminal domain-containing protein [Streptomyces sp. FIT100]